MPVQDENVVEERVALPDDNPEDIAKIMHERDESVAQDVKALVDKKRDDEKKAEEKTKKAISDEGDKIIEEINKDDEAEQEVKTPVVPVKTLGPRRSLEEQEG